MPLDTRLPAMFRGPDLQGSTINAQNLRNARTQNELQQLTLQNARTAQPLVQAQMNNDLMVERVRANVIMSEQLRGMLGHGDTAGAMRFLQEAKTRKEAANQQTQLIDSYLADLEAGDFQSLAAKMNEGLQVARQFNILEAGAGAQAGFRTLSEAEKRARSIPVESFAQVGPDGRVYIDDAPRDEPLVAIDQRGADAATDAFAGEVGKAANERRAAADLASTQNIQLDRMSLALAEGAETGTGESFLLDMKSLGNTIFGDLFQTTPEDSEQAVIRSLGNAIALSIRNPDSGLGLPGATSNRDLQFLQAIAPGIAQGEGGNARIIDYMKRLNDMKIAVNREQNRIIAAEGLVPLDLDTRIAEYVANYDFFTPDERALIDVAQGRAPAPERPSGLDPSLATQEQVDAFLSGEISAEEYEGIIRVR